MIDKRLSLSKRRIQYVNSDTKTLETSIAFFEKRLKHISNIQLTEFSSLDSIKDTETDLLIINAANLTDEAFLQWFPKTCKKIESKFFATPTLFLSRIDFDALEKLWEQAYENNWYFDILHPQHMDSLPIRVANLLRIHDHLHELSRYEEEVENFKTRLNALEKKLEKS
jgi:hypothetical protein